MVGITPGRDVLTASGANPTSELAQSYETQLNAWKAGFDQNAALDTKIKNEQLQYDTRCLKIPIPTILQYGREAQKVCEPYTRIGKVEPERRGNFRNASSSEGPSTKTNRSNMKNVLSLSPSSRGTVDPASESERR